MLSILYRNIAYGPYEGGGWHEDICSERLALAKLLKENDKCLFEALATNRRRLARHEVGATRQRRRAAQIHIDIAIVPPSSPEVHESFYETMDVVQRERQGSRPLAPH